MYREVDLDCIPQWPILLYHLEKQFFNAIICDKTEADMFFFTGRYLRNLMVKSEIINFKNLKINRGINSMVPTARVQIADNHAAEQIYGAILKHFTDERI